MLGGQTPSVVLDDDGDSPAVLRSLVLHGDAHPAFRQSLPVRRWVPREGRFGGILEQVGQRLPDLAGVATERRIDLGKVEGEYHRGMAVAFEEYRVAANLGEVLGLQRRLRHTGERRELVDHASDVLDLADDGLGAGGEDLGLGLDLLQVLAFQALGGKLDGGQGVLDLVGDAPGDIGPCGGALGRQKLGDVVEGNDIADDVFAHAFGGDAYQQRVLPALAHQFDLRLLQPFRPAPGALHQLRHLGNHVDEAFAHGREQVDGQKLRCRAVGQVDASLPIEADDPGGDAGKDGLRETPAFVELAIGLDEAAPLAFELAGHAVEGAIQDADLVAGNVGVDTCREVAVAHPLGRRDQVADGAHKLGGQCQPQPHRRQKQQKRHHHEDHDEGDLRAFAPFFQALVLGDRALRAFDVIHHPGFDETPHQQEGIDVAVELDQGPHAVVLLVDEDHDLAQAGLFQIGRGDQVEIQGKAQLRTHPYAAVAVHHPGFRQRTECRLSRQDLREAPLVAGQDRRFAVEVGGHGEGIGADVLLVLVQVGGGHHVRGFERRAHPFAEPGLNAEVEEQAGEYRDDDGRRHRHQAEQHHQPDVHARPGETAPALGPYLDKLPRHHQAQQQQQDDVQVKQDEDGLRIQGQRRGAGHGADRGQTRDHRRQGQREGELAGHAHVPPPQPEALEDTDGNGKRGFVHLPPRTTGMSSSRIFLRSVLRLSPRTWAALIWLPRVASRVRAISGRSISRCTRA